MSRKKRPHRTQAAISLPLMSEDQVEVLIRRARVIARRGDSRRAMLMLRQATQLDPFRARSFALFAHAAHQRGDHQAAGEALRHALWLRVRDNEPRRAEVVARLLSDMQACAAA